MFIPLNQAKSHKTKQLFTVQAVLFMLQASIINELADTEAWCSSWLLKTMENVRNIILTSKKVCVQPWLVRPSSVGHPVPLCQTGFLLVNSSPSF